MRSRATTFLSYMGAYSRPNVAIIACARRPEGFIKVVFMRPWIGGTCLPWVQDPGHAVPIRPDKADCFACFSHRGKREEAPLHMKFGSMPGRMVPGRPRSNARHLQLSSWRPFDKRDVIKGRDDDKHAPQDGVLSSAFLGNVACAQSSTRCALHRLA